MPNVEQIKKKKLYIFFFFHTYRLRNEKTSKEVVQRVENRRHNRSDVEVWGERNKHHSEVVEVHQRCQDSIQVPENLVSRSVVSDHRVCYDQKNQRLDEKIGNFNCHL